MGDSRDTLYVAVFGTLWGLLEITLGLALKSLRVPFTGFLMAAAATVILLVGRRFATRRGSLVLMGCVAALLKVFSVGGFILGPVLAILAEAVLAEMVLRAVGFNRVGASMAAVLILVYTTMHPLLAQSVLYGAEIVPVYLEMLGGAARLLGVERVGLLAVAAAWVGLVTGLGTATGLAGHHLGARVEARVRALRAEEGLP